jgi:hypothetical protein
MYVCVYGFRERGGRGKGSGDIYINIFIDWVHSKLKIYSYYES